VASDEINEIGYETKVNEIEVALSQFVNLFSPSLLRRKLKQEMNADEMPKSFFHKVLSFHATSLNEFSTGPFFSLLNVQVKSPASSKQ